MIYTFFVLYAFVIVLCFRNFRNRITWLFSIAMIGLSVCLAFTLFYNVKTSNYVALSTFDRNIYSFLARVRVSYYSVITIGVVGLVITFLSKWGLIHFSFASLRQFRGVKALCLFDLLLIVVFAVINSNQFLIRLYIMMQGGHGKGLYWPVFFSNIAVCAYFFIMPYYVLSRRYFKTRIRYKKQSYLFFGFFILFIDACFLILVLNTPMKYILPGYDNLLRRPVMLPLRTNALNVTLPLALIVFILTSAFLLLKYRPLARFSGHPKKALAKKMKLLYSDVRPILHSYKNVLLSVDMVAKRMQITPETERPGEIQEVRHLTESAIDDIASVLDAFNRPNIDIDRLDPVACVYEAAGNLFIPEHIRLEVSDDGDFGQFTGDHGHVVRMLENLFQNSVDAILEKGVSEGLIRVGILSEDDCVCITIRDNGCGIRRRDYFRVFRPLYSTKRTQHKWGIGLSYVRRVAEAHGGRASVTSRWGGFTEFEIVIPIFDWEEVESHE